MEFNSGFKGLKSRRIYGVCHPISHEMGGLQNNNTRLAEIYLYSLRKKSMLILGKDARLELLPELPRKYLI